ncbi:hypothetical protein AeMF1_017697 [Aphanomyces euteiches]|nr:hypothetical protein AeMF1_017697 [Aphanomyces euteiches]KAH9188241.1 hypothetical protein AeNC1_009780 [Aphanomyces euteiches]
MAGSRDDKDDDIPDNLWDDLRFLLATDDGLHVEFTALCDILQGDSSDDKASSVAASPSHHVLQQESARRPTAPPTTTASRMKKQRTRPHFDFRKKQELIMLQREVEQLKMHLTVSQARSKRPLEMSKWEKAAISERIEKNRSIQENEELKEAVQQQATLIQQMEKLSNKKMRLTEDDPEAWQNYRLAAQDSLRVAAIHAIADRQYRRMQNAFIQAEIFASTEDSFRPRITRQGPNCFVFELANHVTLPAPFHVVGSAAWRVFGGPEDLAPTPGTIETTDFVDPNTVYSRVALPQPDGSTLHSNIIRKRYVEEDREVIVARSVLEDALVPHMSKGAVENKCIWFEVERLPSRPMTHCSVNFVVHVAIDPSEAFNMSSLDERTLLEDLMQQALRVGKNHNAKTGKFHVAMPPLEPPSMAYPVLLTLIDRGRIFMTALEHEVNHAVQLKDHLPL